MEDHQILALLFARDESAIRVLDRRFGRRLRHLTDNILPDRRDREETVNDTYLAVWNSVPPKKPNPLAAFVYRIGKNLALKRLRDNCAEKRRANYALSLEELEGCIPGPCLEDSFSARELGQAIDRYLATLSPENRRIFMRRYWYGDSLQQIATGYGLTRNAVNLRLCRSREGLRAFLEKEELL